MKNLLLFLFIFSSFFFYTLRLNAHSLGNSFELVMDDGTTTIDIGYSTEFFFEGESTLFDFSLVSGEKKIPVSFDDVWVRIARLEGKTEIPVFASGIHSFGGTQTPMTFTFPKSGEYILSVRFENGIESLAKTEIPIQVRSSGEWGMSFYEWLTYSCIAAFIIGVKVGKYKNDRHDT